MSLRLHQSLSMRKYWLPVLGLLVPVTTLSWWFLGSHQGSTTDQLARLEGVNPTTLNRIFSIGKSLAKNQVVTQDQWNFLVQCTYDANAQLRQEAYIAMSDARSKYFRGQALDQIYRMKSDVDLVRCYYVPLLVILKADNWKEEVEKAKTDKSELVRSLAIQAEINSVQTWMAREKIARNGKA